MFTLKKTLFAVLGLLLGWFSLFFLAAMVMLAGGRSFPFSVYFKTFVTFFILLAMAGSSLWLAHSPRAWSSASYIPRAIILVVLALALFAFGLFGIRNDLEQHRDMGPATVWGLFIFSVAGTLLWGALPRSWRRRIAPRRKLPKSPS
jgi:FtsH-binding integral membrane protein